MAETIDKTLTYGNFTVHLHISSCVADGDGFIFQFGIGDTSLQSYGRMLISNDMLSIESNIFGGKRIYYWNKEYDLFVTDDVFRFLSEDDLKKFEIDEFENEYFNRHGYTSGDSTRWEKIKKIAPSSLFTVDKNGINIQSTWKLNDIKNTPNDAAFKESIYESVINTLKPLANSNRPIVLCFSGGKDSTYLAKIMNHLGIHYDMAFFRDYTLKVNNKEFIKANKQAGLLGKQLKVIDITNLKDYETEERIRLFNIFDKHYCRYHFYGLEELKKQYGSNLIIVNGQNADSILSYGPSEEKMTSLMKRYLLYGSNTFLKKMFAAAIGFAFRKKFKVPESDTERLCAFYDNFKYCLLLDKDNSPSYTTWLKDKIFYLTKSATGKALDVKYMYLKSQSYMQSSDCQVVVCGGGRCASSNGNEGCNASSVAVQKYENRAVPSQVCTEAGSLVEIASDYNAKLMKIKVFTFMQGPDAQVVTQSADDSGIDLIMPFSTPQIMQATLRYKEDRKELNKPKYALSTQ